MKRTPIKDLVPHDPNAVKVKKDIDNKSIVIDLELSSDATPASLRHYAKLVYATNQNGISLDKLSKLPPFDRICVSELAKWSKEDGWVAEREKYRKSIEKKLINKLRTSHIDSIVKQLEDVDTLAKQMYSILQNDCVVPHSFEGMVNALKKLWEYSFTVKERTEVLLSTQIQDLDEGDSLFETVTTPKVDYNKEALRKMAHQIIKMERDKSKNEKGSKD